MLLICVRGVPTRSTHDDERSGWGATASGMWARMLVPRPGGCEAEGFRT